MATSVKVGVSNVNLRLNIVYADPYTEVNYVIPAASITYVGLQVGAELDITNRNPYVVETIIAVDSVSVGAGKNFFEVLDPAIDQILGFGINKGIDDPVTFFEELSISSGFIREYSDTATISESLGFQYSKEFADSVIMTDELRKAFGMLRADSAIMYDQTDVFDGLEYQFGKGLQDILDGILESSVNLVGKGLDDSVSSSSSGSLYMTDYCDITYFAQDYVGTSLTFT
jgi:hypothetical protein